MSPAGFSVRNSVVANLLMVSIFVLGLLSYVSLPRELMSEINMGWVFIIKPYPGVSAEEIEKLITIPIEEEIQDVKGIESISSYSSEGSCFISVKFEQMPDDEFRDRFEDIRAEVEKVDNLPEDALDTVVQMFTSAEFVPVISVHLHGKVPEKKLFSLARELRDQIMDVPHISKVELTGIRDRELWVEADPIKLEGYALSPEQIRMAIAAHGVDVPAGKLTFGRRELLVRTLGEFEDAGQVARVIVRSTPGGGTVRVGDVARVREGFEDEVTRSRLGLEPVVSMTITKRAEGNSIRITEQVKQAARKFVERYDKVVSVSFTQDSSEQINDILSKLGRNAWFGFIIVLVVLFLVLGFRNAVLAALGIPLSFLACFIAMHRMGESFNGNSLFGLVLVLGIIVDDAIIIVENCYRHRQMGKSWARSAVEGTDEVMSPVFSATATTIAAFLPLMLMPGIMGKFMRIVPVALSLALLASMVEAFIILPAHLAEWPGKDRPVRPEPGWLDEMRNAYERALRFVIGHRYAFCFLLVPLLIAAALAMIPVIGVDMFAGEEIAVFQVRLRMPTGTGLEATSETLEKFERAALDLPRGEVREVHATAGLMITDEDWIFRSDVAQIFVDLASSYQRKRSADQIMNELRARVSGITGPTSVQLAKINTGPPLGKPVEVKVKGKYLREIEAAAEELKQVLAGIPGVTDIGDDFEPGKQEIRLRVDAERAALHGLSVAEVGLALRTAVDGAVADTMYDGDEEIEIVVRVDPEAFHKPDDLLRLPLFTRAGSPLKLGHLARYTVEPSYAQIRRYKLERAITVYSNLDKEKTTTVKANQTLEGSFAGMAKRYPGVNLDFSGEFQEFKESFAGLAQLFAFGILLVYAILGAQFRSYIQPLVILGTVPLAFVGATLGLLVSGNPFSILALYGWVALAGIAVNDAIVLMTFVNYRKQQGADGGEAVIEAGRLRFRPIILTSVTTISGLLPMAVGLGGMSLTWGPMANTIVWGIGVATLMTLFLIPALQVVLMEDIVGRLRRKR